MSNIKTLLETAPRGHYTSWVNSPHIDRRSNRMYLMVQGFSTDTDYIPYYSLWLNRGVYQAKGKTLVHYSILDPENDDYASNPRPSKRYQELINMFMHGDYPRPFKTASMSRPLYAMKGLLFSLENGVPEILLSVNVRSTYATKVNLTNLDYSQFKVFISRGFMTLAKYKTVYSKLDDAFLKSLAVHDIDAVITNDVISKTFVHDTPNLKFDSVLAMQDYFQSLTNLILDD